MHHYRRAIALRHAFPALRSGDQPNMQAEGNVLRFERATPEQRIFVALNLSESPETIQPPAGKWQQIGADLGSIAAGPDGALHLGPWQPAILVEV